MGLFDRGPIAPRLPKPLEKMRIQVICPTCKTSFQRDIVIGANGYIIVCPRGHRIALRAA